MAFDGKCFDLAELFLDDEPALQSEAKKRALAQTIQTAIEDWIGWEKWNAARIAGRLTDAEVPQGAASHEPEER